MAHAVAVGNGNHASNVGEIVPDSGEFFEEFVGPAAAHDEPDLFGDEDFDGYFSQGE